MPPEEEKKIKIPSPFTPSTSLSASLPRGVTDAQVDLGGMEESVKDKERERMLLTHTRKKGSRVG